MCYFSVSNFCVPLCMDSNGYKHPQLTFFCFVSLSSFVSILHTHTHTFARDVVTFVPHSHTYGYDMHEENK